MTYPSVADAVVDDPTVKRVVAFSQRDCMGGAQIVNLFSYRTPYPTDLLHADDPVGPETDTHLAEALGSGDLLVAAWGDSVVLHTPLGQERLRVLRSLLSDVPMVCLGTTKSGHPRHPARLAASTPFVPWEWPAPSTPQVSNDEDQVVQYFELWLLEKGWTIKRGQGWPDVVAERDGRLLVAEAKGATGQMGLDVDTGYGQLLRRMEHRDVPLTYGLVVPTALRDFALRVSDEVRAALGITVYLVDANGEVAVV